MMLRECVRVQELAEIILKAPEFYKFFDYVQKSTFDIASDAFATFKAGFVLRSMPEENQRILLL